MDAIFSSLPLALFKSGLFPDFLERLQEIHENAATTRHLKTTYKVAETRLMTLRKPDTLFTSLSCKKTGQMRLFPWREIARFVSLFPLLVLNRTWSYGVLLIRHEKPVDIKLRSCPASLGKIVMKISNWKGGAQLPFSKYHHHSKTLMKVSGALKFTFPGLFVCYHQIIYICLVH